MRQIHDIKLDYDSTLGHEMQVRVHATEAADGLEYIPAGKGFMIELVDELATNSIRHGGRTHKLLDGAVVKVKQSYGVQVIDIYPPEEELEVKHYGLFSFKPRPDAPTAIIIESESENATDGIELYFDDRIQSGGIHTQDNTAYSEEVTEPVQLDDRTQRDNLYSIWMDARSTTGKNCASWSQGYMNRKYDVSTYQEIRQCDDFVDNKYLWYYGLTTRYAYVGGRLLYEAYYYDDVLGVGEVHGEEGSLLVYVLINRYSKSIRLLTAPIPVVNYESHSEDPIHKLSDLTEVESEFIEIPDRRHPLSAFTFSSDGTVGSMSVYDWHEGSVISEYRVTFDVEVNIDDEKELKWEIEKNEEEHLVETVRSESPPVPPATPGGGGGSVTTTYNLPFNHMAEAGHAECSEVGGFPADCDANPEPCNCDPPNQVVNSETWCGGADVVGEMIAFVHDEYDPEGCPHWDFPDGPVITYGSHNGNCDVVNKTTKAEVWWFSKECTKNAHHVLGNSGGYASCYYETVTTAKDAIVTPEIPKTSNRVTTTLEPLMPFAQVMGHDGELLTGVCHSKSDFSDVGDESSANTPGQTTTSLSAFFAVCMSSAAIDQAVAAWNKAYGHPYHHSWERESSYSSKSSSSVEMRLPWRTIESKGTSSIKESYSGHGTASSAYQSYYSYYKGADYNFGDCCYGMSYTEIPSTGESDDTTSTSAKSKNNSSTYIEGDLRYEIACTLDREIESSSSSTDGEGSASYSSVAWYSVEEEEIPGLDRYQKVNTTTIPDSGTGTTENSAAFLHKKPLGLAFMAHPKGYGLVSLSDKRFVVDMDPEATDWKVTLQLYNKKTEAFTDILEMYNDALKPYNEYIVENGGEKIEELQSEINADDGPDKGKLNQMGEFFGVLSRIPRPQMRFEQ